MKTLSTLLLTPSDVLFFRDGRPMSGSLSGHGAAWPLPTVLHAALHAALWRADLPDFHAHRQGSKGKYGESRNRKFGSVLTAGPFPVLEETSGKGEWLFPRPMDAGEKQNPLPTFQPLSQGFEKANSSLPDPLCYAVANTLGPTKEIPHPWWNAAAWAKYLGLPQEEPITEGQPGFYFDSDFSDTEFSYGIGIDADTGTQDGESFYSAHYLRLRDSKVCRARLGLLASAHEKVKDDPGNTRNLLDDLFSEQSGQQAIVVGGQQRICSVQRNHPEHLPLPHGKISGFEQQGNKYLVKWILLTPAVFPQIEKGKSQRDTEREAHCGGWIPSWICPKEGKVLLQTISPEERKDRRRANAAGQGYQSHPNIDAHLVAAMVGKPIPVTGYALPHQGTGEPGGPKPTHLAVPAGSVYYFEADSPEAAEKLAAALNWHGAETSPTTVRNRRSTLFGEKGFGLGVCGTWQFQDGKLPT